MQISARILAHSIAPCGAEVATMEWIYPRFIHSEIMTHRGLSKNAASSRAIPIKKMLARIEKDPVIPMVWGKNQKGMQGGDELIGGDRAEAKQVWLDARDKAVYHAAQLDELGLHKQIVNRITEPWMWITIIVSATSWENVWGLRCHPDAEPHFQVLAKKARDALEASMPRALSAGEWHLPLIDWDDEIDKSIKPDDLPKISLARCARVSYLTHDGKRDLAADLDLYDRMAVQDPKHASPAEHVAQAMDWPKW